MISVLNNTGNTDLVLSHTTISPGQGITFHPVIFTDEDLGLIITSINTGDAHIEQMGYEVEDSNKVFNDMCSESTIRGAGMPLTFTEWHEVGEIIGYDYKFVRAMIYTEMEDYDSLTDAEKDIVCSYVLVDLDTMKAQLGDKYEHSLSEWDRKSKICRVNRYEKAKTYLYQALELADAKSILVELTTGQDLATRYAGGIEGTLEDEGAEGLFDYIESRSGTSYENTGLSSKSFTPKDGLTMEAVSSVVMNILNTGSDPY